LEKLWSENEEKVMKKLNLIISPQLSETLDKRRIRRKDIEEVILEAEKDGSQFLNQKTGPSLSNLRPRQATFWVGFEKQENGSYKICLRPSYVFA
jgi:hypothetical protein